MIRAKTTEIRILHLEDLQSDVEMVERALRKGELVFNKSVVENRIDFEKALIEFIPDIVLSDHTLPSFDSLMALKIVQDSGLHIPFILVTATVSEEFAVEVMRLGADDYILKDRLQRLPNAVRSAVAKKRSEKRHLEFIEQIVHSEALMTDVQRLAGLGSLDIDLLNNKVTWSKELYHLLDYEVEKIEPSIENFLRRVHPEDAEHVRMEIESPAVQLDLIHLDFRLKMDDDSIRYINSELQIERNEEREPVRIIGFNQDVTIHKKAEEKISKAKHLYAFISQVNQNIVRVKDQETLFRNACNMALTFGKFKMAWIGLFDAENKKITLADQSGIPPEEIELFSDVPFETGGPQDQVLRSGEYYICNDVQSDLELESWKSYALKHDIRSCLVLPIKKSGAIIGTFNLYSTQLDFSGSEEINLLIEVTCDISFALDLFEKERKHKATEEMIVKNEKQFRHTLDNMIEGIQIHDFDWRYIYVNNALVNYSTYSREELLGATMMSKYPGIEQTHLFEVMQRCMRTRNAEHLETEFVFPDLTRANFELSIQPIPEGIFVLSVDRTEQKKAKDKLQKVNRLYAFISAINQSIVHISDREKLLMHACDVAVDIGQFKMGWIDMLDERTGKINMVSMRSDPSVIQDGEKHSGMEYNNSLLRDTPNERALRTGQYAVSNDVRNDPAMSYWRMDMEEAAIKASISLPIKKAGKVVGIFGLHSSIEHFFDEQEISLLEEATGDISFALENFDRTEKHKNTEELVIKNELRFRSLIENSADMITLVTAQGVLLYGSPSIEKVLGYQLEDLIHKPDYEFIHADDLPSFIRLTAAIIRTPGGSFRNQQRLRHKNGAWVWCEGTVTNMLHQPGVLAIVSNFRDITDKKSMEQQQDFNKNNLKALINNTTDLMWSVDRNLNLITSNQPFDEMVVQMSGMIIQKGSSMLGLGFSNEQSNRFKGFYERAFTGEAFTEIEYTSNPAEFWSEISYYPILKDGEVIGTACHSRNISEIKKAERKLKESESFNRAVFNSLTSQIAVIDNAGSIVAINESWKRFAAEYGNTVLQRTGVGNNYFEVCEGSAQSGDEVAAEVLVGLKSVMEGNTSVFHFEYPCHSLTRQRWFSMRAMKFDSIEPLIVVAHEDISERKLAEESLIYKNEELLKTNLELDRFVYSASHDLRAPLCSILGLVSLIELESKETNTLEYTKMIESSVNRLDGFIKNILSYSKNNRLELEINHIPLQKTIDEVVNSLRHMKEAMAVKFQIDVDEQQPFYCDLRRFNIILENLISNAIKFQDYKRSDRFIKVVAKSDPNNLNLEITDNGIGVQHGYQSKIFDMFFRISGERDGSGIGLYIVKETVTKLNGSILLDSQENIGTTFTIRLKNFTPEGIHAV